MKKERTVRLIDVAKRAGVGVGTASRVLNNEPSVSEEKRNRVLQAIEEMGYQRNAIARSLKISSTKTIGVIIPDIANEFYSEIVRGAEDVARGQRYSIILCNTDSKPAEECRTITLLSEKQVDGFILITHDMCSETKDCLKKTGIPTVLVSTLFEDSEMSTVNIDNEQAAMEMVEYLIRRGHRSIAMIAGPVMDIDGGGNRLRGYQKALEKNKLIYDERLVERGEYSYNTGYLCMEKLLSKGVYFSAVFTASDHMAIGCMKLLAQHHLRVPEDISVVGFDNLSIAEFTTPGLTTVNQPRYQMGQAAIRQLCTLLAGEKLEKTNLIVRHTIVERSSVMRIDRINEN